MAFKLTVNFGGLCLFMVHPEGPENPDAKVTVIMPDGRDRPTGFVLAPDRKPLSPHVGYLRCSLADVRAGDGGPPGGNAPGDNRVGGELVYRFEREDLRFAVASPSTGARELVIPDLDCVFPQLRPIPNLLSGPLPANRALMRTEIGGGEWRSKSRNHRWWFRTLSGGPNTPCGGDFAEDVTWTATVDAPFVDLTITRWRSDDTEGTPRLLRLAPARGDSVVLTLANLCSDNPLGWDALGTPKMDGLEDKDFRWFYQLFEPPGGWNPAFADPDGALKLPIPLLDQRSGEGKGNPPGCLRAKYQVKS